jgi:hypothetical protein
LFLFVVFYLNGKHPKKKIKISKKKTVEGIPAKAFFEQKFGCKEQSTSTNFASSLKCGANVRSLLFKNVV